MPRRGKKNVMLDFKMDEISAVDRPAQQSARAVIMKRDGVFDEQLAEAEDQLEVLRAEIFETLQERARLAAGSVRQLEEVRDRVAMALQTEPDSDGLRGLMRAIDQRLTALRAAETEQAQRAAAETFKSEPTLEEHLAALRASPSRHAARLLKIRCERDYGRLMRKSEDWAVSEEYERIDAVQREADAYMAYAT